MKGIRCRIVTFACVMLLMSIPALAATPGEVREGEVLKEARLYGFAGDFRWLSEFRGKPLIINVWASWCGPCRAEMGSLDRLAKRFGGNQFNIIGVSTDDDAEAAMAFLLRSGITFDNYLDNKLTMEYMLGAETIPLTVLIGADGRVLSKIHGAREWDSPGTVKMIAKVFGVVL